MRFWYHGLRNAFITVAERDLLLPRSLTKRLVNHARSDDITDAYAADWTLGQLYINTSEAPLKRFYPVLSGSIRLEGNIVPSPQPVVVEIVNTPPELHSSARIGLRAISGTSAFRRWSCTFSRSKVSSS